MKVLYVLTIIMASLVCLPSVYAQERFGAHPPNHDVGVIGEATGDHTLYVRLKPSEVKPVKQSRQADRLAYPSLYSAGRSEGVIVLFGFPACGFCTLQANVIPDNYRVLKVNRDESDSPGGPTWRELMTKWEVVDTFVGKEVPAYPTTVIVVDGIPVQHFTAYKPWRIIKAHSEKAQFAPGKPKPKDNEKKPNRRNMRDRPFRDWLFRSSNDLPRFGLWR